MGAPARSTTPSPAHHGRGAFLAGHPHPHAGGGAGAGGSIARRTRATGVQATRLRGGIPVKNDSAHGCGALRPLLLDRPHGDWLWGSRRSRRIPSARRRSRRRIAGGGAEPGTRKYRLAHLHHERARRRLRAAHPHPPTGVAATDHGPFALPSKD
jgi:hypothetical protein